MTFLNPTDALREFGLYGALFVADLGAGGGHFTLEAARRLEGGTLYAVDLDADLLARVVSDARERGHSHVHPIRADIAKLRGVPLQDAALDRALAVNVLFSASDRDFFVQEAKRLLKPGGKLLLIDWTTDTAIGPHAHHKISKETALGLFTRHGFTHEKDISAGEYHYGMILVR